MSDTTEPRMTRTERNELIKLARRRARVAKQDAEALAASMTARVEEQLASTFDALDDRWKDAIQRTKKAIEELNAKISEELTAEGLPAQFHPGAGMAWHERGESREAFRRAELRRVAKARITERLTQAKADIDRAVVRIESDLLAVTTGAEAREYLLGMPTAEALLPAGMVSSMLAELLAAPSDGTTDDGD